jgi:hypothetical protein
VLVIAKGKVALKKPKLNKDAHFVEEVKQTADTTFGDEIEEFE